MDFSLISNTFITIFTTDVFFYCILGVVAGMVIGTLPGLSATMGIAILTPLTFWLEPAQGMAVLLGPFVLALLLGNLCESNFRRALSMSLGDYSIFLTRPITVVLLILTVLSLVLPAIGQLRKKSKAAK